MGDGNGGKVASMTSAKMNQNYIPNCTALAKGGLCTWMLTATHVHILSSHLSHNMGNYFSPSLYRLRQKSV